MVADGSASRQAPPRRRSYRRILSVHLGPDLPDGVAVYSAIMTKNRPDSASPRPNRSEAKIALYQYKRAHSRNPSAPPIPNPKVAGSIPAGGAGQSSFIRSCATFSLVTVRLDRIRSYLNSHVGLRRPGRERSQSHHVGHDHGRHGCDQYGNDGEAHGSSDWGSAHLSALGTSQQLQCHRRSRCSICGRTPPTPASVPGRRRCAKCCQDQPSATGHNFI